MEQRRIEDVVAQDGIYVGTTSGVSMYPMLRDRRDTIIIQPCRGRLKKYDVPLYHRGEKYVLHRIVKVLPDSYDHSFLLSKETVRQRWICFMRIKTLH